MHFFKRCIKNESQLFNAPAKMQFIDVDLLAFLLTWNSSGHFERINPITVKCRVNEFPLIP